MNLTPAFSLEILSGQCSPFHVFSRCFRESLIVSRLSLVTWPLFSTLVKCLSGQCSPFQVFPRRFRESLIVSSLSLVTWPLFSTLVKCLPFKLKLTYK
eukprot:g26467.t1